MSISGDKAEAALALLRQAELSPSEVQRRLDFALDPMNWRQMVPFASIGGDLPTAECVHIAPEEATRQTRRLGDEDYFHLGKVVDEALVARLHRIVESVRATGWPAVFAFVYDDFWNIARSARLLEFLDGSLGTDCLQNTVVWAHWVAGIAGSSGWHPHYDARGEGGEFLSVWIALSDATVDNGCMFLVRPRAVADSLAQAVDARAALPYDSYRRLLQNVVALPAVAGSIIGWRGDVLHWGGVNTGSAMPRVALALEFRSRVSKASRFEWPLIDPRSAPPPFRLRLFSIAKALREYAKFEPTISRYRALAEKIWTETTPPP